MASQMTLIEKSFLVIIIVLVFFVGLAFDPDGHNIVLIKTLFFFCLIWPAAVLWITIRILGRSRSVANEQIRGFPPLLVPAGTFFLIALLSLALSRFKYASFEEVLNFGSYFALYLIILGTVKRAVQGHLILICVMLVAALAGLYGIMQQVGWDFVEWRHLDRIISTFGNPNFFAGFLIMVIPLFLAFTLTSVDARSKTLYAAGLLLGLACLVLTYSRAAWIGCAISLAFFFAIYLWVVPVPIKKFNTSWLLGLAASAAIVAALLTLPGTTRSVQRVVIAKGPGSGLRVRMEAWKAAINMFRDYPALGSGVGTYQLYFPIYKDRYAWRSGIGDNTIHAHNEYLEVLGEMGALGLAAYILIFVVYFQKAIRNIQIFRREMSSWSDIKRTRKQFRSREFSTKFQQGSSRWMLIQTGLASGIAAILIQGLFGVNLRWTCCAFFLWLLMGLSMSIYYHGWGTIQQLANQDEKSMPLWSFERMGPYKRWLVFVPAGLILAGIAFASIRIYRADLHLETGSTYLEAKDYQSAMPHLDRAIQLNPYCLEARYELAAAFALAEQPEAAVAVYDALSRYAPHYASIYLNRGICYLNLGNLDNAERDLHRALAHNDSPDVHVQLMRLNNQRGDLAQVEAGYRTAVALDRKCEAAYLLMAHVYREDGRTSEAIATLREGCSAVSDGRDLHWILGQMLDEAGEFEAARKEYYTVLNIDPMDFKAHNNLGILYLNAGNLEGAIFHLSRAVDLEPGAAVANLNLGRALSQAGKYPQAFRQLSKVVQLDPNGPYGLEARRLMEEIRNFSTQSSPANN